LWFARVHEAGLFHTVYELIFLKKEFILVHRSVETVEKNQVIFLVCGLETKSGMLSSPCVNGNVLIGFELNQISTDVMGLLKNEVVRKQRSLTL